MQNFVKSFLVKNSDLSIVSDIFGRELNPSTDSDFPAHSVIKATGNEWNIFVVKSRVRGLNPYSICYPI